MSKKIFFTSDQHLKHKNILRHCPDRKVKFETIDRMDNAFIELHNEVVKAEDEVWHVGDFCWARADQHHFYQSTLDKLNGTHHLILGNHDYCKPFYYVDIGFTSVHTANMIKIGKYKLVLAHDPAVWNAISAIKDFIIFISGHIHLLYKALPKQNLVNVGVDAWNYKPVEFEQILELLQTHKDEEKLNI